LKRRGKGIYKIMILCAEISQYLLGLEDVKNALSK